jgi:hypothetical protein
VEKSKEKLIKNRVNRKITLSIEENQKKKKNS